MSSHRQRPGHLRAGMCSRLSATFSQHTFLRLCKQVLDSMGRSFCKDMGQRDCWSAKMPRQSSLLHTHAAPTWRGGLIPFSLNSRSPCDRL